VEVRGTAGRMVYRAFGLTIDSAFELPGMPELPAGDGDPVRLRLVDETEVRHAWSGSPDPPVWETVLDGRDFSFEAGNAGDHLFGYGDEATFHANAAADEVLCAPADPGAPDWQRVLLDTILYSVSLLRGFEALHACAVEFEQGPVAVIAAQGGGKTSIAAALVRRGHPLFCDDILALARGEGPPVAHPGPPVMNLPGALEENGLPAGWRRLARLGDESWVAVGDASTEPRTPAAIALLERRPGGKLDAELLPQNPLPLVPHALGMRHRPERMRGTFETLCDLAESAPLYRLSADPASPPDALADLVEGMASR
jgi:hypothetical protein